MRRSGTVSRLIIPFLIVILLTPACLAETLSLGMKGDEVKTLQQALIDQNYLTGKADGIFGTATEEAVKAFQKANRLTVDGAAGKKTQGKLYEKQKSGLFSGDYATIRDSSDPDRVKTLQKALIDMKYLQSGADGEYGTATKAAVKKFQTVNGLKADGLAGRKTLTAVEKAVSSGQKYVSPLETAEPLEEGAGKIDPPAKSDIQLLHWYNDIKPRLSSNARLTVYEPSSGLAWTLKVHSRGRHCDAEPLSIQDTQIMLKAFGGKNTWNQKGVYVKLPDGRWTVGATHSMPHLSNYIRDNGFDGHLCVHFFRDMEECQQTDPNYGTSNQRTIRSLWKKISGETVE